MARAWIQKESVLQWRVSRIACGFGAIFEQTCFTESILFHSFEYGVLARYIEEKESGNGAR
jgi:hypothetical protein